MGFQKGKRKTGGRLPGVTNKFTGAFRDAVQVVYNGLGGHIAFLEWAKENRTEYYRIAARLIPGEMQEGDRAGTLTVIVQRNPPAVLPVIEDQRRNTEE